MARAPMKEGINNEATLDNIESNIMTLIIDFMYEGTITVKKADIQDLLEACDYLNIPELKDRLLLYVPKLLTLGNAIGWVNFTTLHHFDNTAELVQQFLADKFRQVAQCHEFLNFSVEELKDFLTKVHLLSDDVLYGVFSWIDEDKEARVGQINIATDININLHGCSIEMLGNIKARYPDSMANSLLYQQIGDMHLESAAEAVTDLPIIVVGGYSDRYEMWKLNTNKQFKHLQTTQNMEYSAGSYSVCQYDDVGVLVTDLYCDEITVYVYDCRNNTWDEKDTYSLESDPSPQVSVCIENELFVMCDSVVDDGVNTKSRTLYTTLSNFDWQNAPGAPVEKLAIARHGTDAYVIGEANPNLYQFDTQLKTWNQKAALPYNPGAGYSMTGGGGKIYAAGGKNNICCVYEPDTDTWTDICRPLHIHRHGALVFHDNKLALLGGQSSEIEKYDIKKNKWIMMPYTLPKSMSHHYAFVLHQQ